MHITGSKGWCNKDLLFSSSLVGFTSLSHLLFRLLKSKSNDCVNIKKPNPFQSLKCARRASNSVESKFKRWVADGIWLYAGSERFFVCFEGLCDPVLTCLNYDSMLFCSFRESVENKRKEDENRINRPNLTWKGSGYYGGWKRRRVETNSETVMWQTFSIFITIVEPQTVFRKPVRQNASFEIGAKTKYYMFCSWELRFLRRRLRSSAHQRLGVVLSLPKVVFDFLLPITAEIFKSDLWPVSSIQLIKRLFNNSQV